MTRSVSVIIPVHNCLPYLEDTLASVHEQTLEGAELEVVAVDDGSTDGSGDVLAQWARRWPSLNVVTQEASGAAGRPRNVGIDHATGEYVYFLDGDDCLGPEALERLLAMARRNDSDVVYGRVVGVGRPTYDGIYAHDVDRAELTRGVYYSLTPSKLIRRQLLLDHDIRFPEDMRIMEDQPFISRCLLAATTVSILGSYDCYYLVRREDGSNVSAAGLPLPTVLAQADSTVQSILAETQPGPVRDHFVTRHVRIEMLKKFGAAHLGEEEATRRERVATAAPYARTWWSERLDPDLSVAERLMVRALAADDSDALDRASRWSLHGARGAAVRDGERWLLSAPGFRTPEGHPDDVYEMRTPPKAVSQVERVELSGGRMRAVGRSYFVGIDPSTGARSAALVDVDGDTSVPMHLEAQPSSYLNATLGAPGLSYAGAGFTASVDLRTVPPGTRHWGVVVTMEAQGLTEAVRSVPTRRMRPAEDDWTHSDGRAVHGRAGTGGRGFLVLTLDDVAPSPRRSARSVARRVLKGG